MLTNVYASGEDSLFGGKKGVIDVDRAGEGYMTNIRSLRNDETGMPVDPDDIKKSFESVLGIRPYDDIYKGVIYMPLMENAGLALNVAGENPTVPADWGDMTILKGRAARAAKLDSFMTPSTSKILNN